MIKLLVRIFIPDFEKAEDRKVRERVGLFSGILSVICNLILFTVKLAVGVVMNSIAVISDAFNNLSDFGASVISIIGVKASNKRPDREHPFGHGRIEYIASLIVSFLIILVGFELLKASAENIIHPKPVVLTPVTTGLLVFSVLIKLWMFFGNRYLGKKIGSTLLMGTARDSLFDSISTLAVIAAAALSFVFSDARFAGSVWAKLPYDGVIGVCVSLLILYGGFQAAREVAGLLLGHAPSAEIVKEIGETVMAGENIVGVHDLIVHDYGPGRVIASVHAEVPADCGLVQIHQTIDAVEQEVLARFGIVLVIHVDPVITGNKRIKALRALTERLVKEAGETYSIHDFQVAEHGTEIEIIFDMAVPYDTPREVREQAAEKIKNRLREAEPRCVAVIRIDNSYDEN